MQSILDRLNTIHRPRLLIQAARIGSATYRRDLQLRRLCAPGQLPRSAPALAMLMELEDEMNLKRRAKETSYCAAEHVDILIAMMGEARLLRAAYPLEVVKSPDEDDTPNSREA